MSEPQARVAESAKKTVTVRVRLSRLEAQQVERKVKQHDPPTMSAYLRSIIVDQIKESSPLR